MFYCGDFAAAIKHLRHAQLDFFKAVATDGTSGDVVPPPALSPLPLRGAGRGGWGNEEGKTSPPTIRSQRKSDMA
jgi:hypothetical protein